jgi:hypothetical protein
VRYTLGAHYLSKNTVFTLLSNPIGLGMVIIKLVSSGYSTNLAFLSFLPESVVEGSFYAIYD